ncbi:hypothetical protein ACFVVB_19920 [Streptomyces californicus]|uniref:hypothetical protein n=1 Tax=Streptomyces californicus TaxID=67351 RepID=UPI0036DD0EE9
MRKIMIIGAGDLGQRVCAELAHSDRQWQIRLVGRDGETLRRQVNLIRFSSLQRGFHSRLDHALTDLNDIDRTAEVIAEFAPDVVFLAASLQSWWVISTLPAERFQRLYAANFGPWLPMHLAPVHKAMQAIQAADSQAIVVNAAYPDAVHPVLAGAGLAPHIGIGNVANNVPALRYSAGAILDIAPAEVDVRMVTHHYVSHRLSRTTDISPAQLRIAILAEGRDVVPDIGLVPLLKPLTSDYRRTGGLAGQAMTAASAVSVLLPLLEQREAMVHAPGPLGLPGGYPVVVGPGPLRLALPPGLAKDEAVAINQSGQVGDGIRAIGDDGSVLFEESTMDVMRWELGYHCLKMPLSEAEDRARELAARFARYQERQSHA